MIQQAIFYLIYIFISTLFPRMPKPMRDGIWYELERISGVMYRGGLNEIATAILEPDVTAKAPV